MKQLNNSIAPSKPETEKSGVTYQINGEDITLSASIVKNYLTNGNGAVTPQEIAYFVNFCKYQKLNPLIKECYLIKYGSQPAIMVTSKEALLKRAMRNPRYRGHEAGVIVKNKETDTLEYRKGSFVLSHEDLIGGWAKTYVEGYAVPIESAVSFHEYVGTKVNGEANSMWGGKPGTMIRKVALVNSLREAFPEDLGGLYASEEVGVDETDTGEAAIPQMPAEQPTEPTQIPEEDYSQIPPDFDEPPYEELPQGF